MSDREMVIKGLEQFKVDFKPFCGNGSDWARVDNAIALLKEQEPKTPIHIHEEHPEHDWETDENGKIDEFAMEYEYHNGPMCKRCYHSFCIHCNPNGFNDGPCVIDEYKCPKCGCILQKGTKFCSKCGQAVKWE